jgi:MFS family permease
VGIAVGALAVTALFLRPIAGRPADRRGRRPLLVWGAVPYAAATAAHAIAPDLLVMVGLRLALGVAEAFFFDAERLARASRRRHVRERREAGHSRPGSGRSRSS